MMRSLFILFCAFVASIAHGQAPEPMGFDEMMEMSAPAPAPRVVAKRRQAIEETRDVLETAPMDPLQRARVLLGLAHLYHEIGRTERDHEALQTAAELYEQILRNHPQFPLADHATFFLGFVRRSLGEHGVARDVLTKVIELYPGSEYAPHAYLHLGESYFQTEEWERSLAAFEQSVAHGQFEFWHFALYKLAWCYERNGNDDQARQTMGRVVLEQASANPRLSIAAFEVLQFWYGQAGMSLEARYSSAIESAAMALNRERLPQIALGCMEQVRELQASIGEEPLSPNSPVFQFDIVVCHLDENRRGNAMAEFKRLEALYGPRSRWYEANDKWSRKTAKDLIKQAKGLLREAEQNALH